MTGTEIVAVTWGLGLLSVLTLCGLAILVRQHRTGRLIIDDRQLAVRLAGGVLLCGLWLLLGWLLLYLPAHPEALRRWAWLGLAAAIGIVGLLLILVLVDLRLLMVNQLRAEERLTAEAMALLARDADDP